MKANFQQEGNIDNDPKVMAPVSAWAHCYGIPLCHYLDNWLGSSPSRTSCILSWGFREAGTSPIWSLVRGSCILTWYWIHKKHLFSISITCHLLTKGSLMLSFTQSSISFPVKVLAGLSSVLGEADARWSFAGVFPSIVSKRTGEVHFQSRVVADVSQLPVSRGLSFVAGFRKSSEEIQNLEER